MVTPGGDDAADLRLGQLVVEAQVEYGAEAPGDDVLCPGADIDRGGLEAGRRTVLDLLDFLASGPSRGA